MRVQPERLYGLSSRPASVRKDRLNLFSVVCSSTVNVGGYIQAVLDRNLAENISRVLYPNDNVSKEMIAPLHSPRLYSGHGCSVHLGQRYQLNDSSGPCLWTADFTGDQRGRTRCGNQCSEGQELH